MAFTQSTPQEPSDIHMENIPHEVLNQAQEKIPDNVTLPEIPQTP